MKEIIASNLAIAFYSAQDPRPAYLGKERRKGKTPQELVRDLRSPSITPSEVYEVYERFLRMLEKESD